MAVTPDDVRRVVDSLGIPYRETTRGELKLERCPYCEPAKSKAPYAHFAVSAQNGLFNCLRGSCGERGNLWRLARDHGTVDLVTKAGGKPTYRRPEEKPGLTCPAETFYDWYSKARGIDAATVRKYGVGGTQNGAGWTIVYHFRDESGRLVNRKYRAPDKRQWQEKDCEQGYYGLQFVDPKKGPLVVTEGEDDCHALAQLGIENVVSVPSGATAYTPAMHKVNQRFGRIVTTFDNDPAGQDGAQKFARKAGLGKCRNVILPFKDARECLQNGVDVFKIAGLINQARPFESDEIVRAGKLRDRVLKSIVDTDRSIGRRTGQDDFDEILGGFRPGEMTIVIGHTGSGKSTLAYNMAHWAESAGLGSLIMSFENRLEAVILKMISTATGEQVRRFDPLFRKWMLCQKPEWIAEQIDALDGRKMHFLNRSVARSLGYYRMEQIEQGIDYAVKFHDVKFVVIDHLHYFLKLSAAQNPVLLLDETVRRLKVLSETQDIHLVLLVHPSKTEDGRTGKLVKLGLNSSKGSSAIAQEADNFMIVERGTGEKGKHRARVHIVKNRELGIHGTVDFEVLPNRNTFEAVRPVPTQCGVANR